MSEADRFGRASGQAGPDADRVGQQPDPFVQNLDQLIALEPLHPHQQRRHSGAAAPGEGIREAGGLGRERLAFAQQFGRGSVIPARALPGPVQLVRAFFWEDGRQGRDAFALRERRQVQRDAARTDRGQELFGAVAEQEEGPVFRRLLQDLQQRVLGAGVHVVGPRDQIDLAPALVRADIEVRPGSADQIHADGLLLRLVHGDDVRMDAVKHLPALQADAAGPPVAGCALHRGGEDAGKGMLSASRGAGDQVAVGDAVGCKRRLQRGLQLPVSQQPFHAPTSDPFPDLSSYHIFSELKRKIFTRRQTRSGRRREAHFSAETRCLFPAHDVQ